MEKRELYGVFEKILEQELVPAMGCTEPIALAYCAAVARKELGCLPERVLVEVSGNIIKNAKSVIVPSTNGARGILQLWLSVLWLERRSCSWRCFPR